MPPKNTAEVAPLTKVALSLETLPKNQQTAEDAPAVAFEFICGLGTEGLSAFEMNLLGKSKGACLTLSVDKTQAAPHFEHLLTPLLQAVQTRPPFDLYLEITSVSAASEREVVQALTQKIENSGSACGCGCSGCG